MLRSEGIMTITTGEYNDFNMAPAGVLTLWSFSLPYVQKLFL